MHRIFRNLTYVCILLLQFMYHTTTQQAQNICITFVQRRPNVFDTGPTLFKCYTNVCFFVCWGYVYHGVWDMFSMGFTAVSTTDSVLLTGDMFKHSLNVYRLKTFENLSEKLSDQYEMHSTLRDIYFL